MIQRAPYTTEAAVGTTVGSAHGGTGMPAPVQAMMEQRFGTDFSRVRVHSDAAAGRSAIEHGARAYTRGQDIYFAPGQYQPHSGPGLGLLAHELSHVVQQRNGRYAPASAAAGGALTYMRLEREAERAERAFAQSAAPVPVEEVAPAGMIQRSPEILDSLRARLFSNINDLADYLWKHHADSLSPTAREAYRLYQQYHGMSGTIDLVPEAVAELESAYQRLRELAPSWVPLPNISFVGPTQQAGVLSLSVAVVALLYAVVFVVSAMLVAAIIHEIIEMIKRPLARRATPAPAPAPPVTPPVPAPAPIPPVARPAPAPVVAPRPAPAPRRPAPTPGPRPVPVPRRDACLDQLNLLPGINDRWHRQRGPIAGHTTVSSAAFRLDRGINPPAGQDTTPDSRNWVRGIGLPADDAGHLIANRFGGRADFNSANGNIFPQDLSYNRGTMRSYDSQAAALHQRGGDVCVHISLEYASPAELRPGRVLYTYLYRSVGATGFNPRITAQVPNP